MQDVLSSWERWMTAENVTTVLTGILVIITAIYVRL
jgi:hypothetical protein